jgi:DNA-directed RNA polymerase subunit RPC12/RpoP
MADQPPVVEWIDEAKPLAICMGCDTEYPEPESVCPKCNLKLLVVHRCARCSRISALKHLRCPYCAFRFVKGDELESSLESGTLGTVAPQELRMAAAQKRRQRKLLVFAVAVFVLVFAAATLVLRFQAGRSPVFTVLGSSYTLHITDLRQAASQQTFSIGKLGQSVVVEITGIKQDERGNDWYEIRQKEARAYVPVNELAPPKGANADYGYRLLRVSLTNLSDPSELADAGQAVDLFRHLYPSDPRGQELLWLLAGRANTMSARGHSREASSAARKAYQELAAANGEYSDRARDALKQLPAPPPGTRNGASPARSQGIEVIGASNGGPGGSKKAITHQVMLLNQTRVLVNLPDTGQVQTGQVLLAHVASDVMTNNEVAIPGGSSCRVRVTATGTSANAGFVGLQLQSLQVGERNYAVDAFSVQVPVSDLRIKAGSPVLFLLRRSLVLSR